jgi:ribonuclease Z
VARLHVLGTAGAVANAAHGHTFLAIEGESGVVLVDSGHAPVVRLARARLDIDCLQAVIATHFHPDHVATLPCLLLSAWLPGRTTPLTVYGLPDTIERLGAMMDLYGSQAWPGFYDLRYRRVAATVGATVMETADARITSTPTRHSAPSIGVRVESLASQAAVVYSSDTEPCGNLVELARGAAILFHEATGELWGHSGPAQAGAIARRAGVGRLVLVHYPPELEDRPRWVSIAAQAFGGPVELAHDYGVYEF